MEEELSRFWAFLKAASAIKRALLPKRGLLARLDYRAQKRNKHAERDLWDTVTWLNETFRSLERYEFSAPELAWTQLRVLGSLRPKVAAWTLREDYAEWYAWAYFLAASGKAKGAALGFASHLLSAR